MNSPAVCFGEADLTSCDREPIHTPGSIQPHGLLLVIDRNGLIVEQVAGDSLCFLEREQSAVIGRSIRSLLEVEAAKFVAEQLSAPAAAVTPVVRFGVRALHGSMPLDLTLHATGDTALLELERSQPGRPDPGDPITQVKFLVNAVQHAANVDECCKAAAAAMRRTTGFDRAMVYRFLPDGSGVIVAEDVNAGLESFLGLHYPASDIPRQARELYRRNWLRAIPTIDYRPAPLNPAINPRTHLPIDMSLVDLRSVSPIHLEYLRNMGIGASLSASIIFNDRLWGMLVLHHCAARRIASDLRVACETFAQILSLHIEAKEQAEKAVLRQDSRLIRDRLITDLVGSEDLGSAIAASDLLRYVDAGGAIICLDGCIQYVGVTPAACHLKGILEWLNERNQPLIATDNLAAALPGAQTYCDSASGILAIALSREPREYVMWFRPESHTTVRWAGNPSKPMKSDLHGPRLTPRGSFAEWLEVTRMHSQAWSDIDIESAESLRVVLLEALLQRVDAARREQLFNESCLVAQELEARVAQRTAQLKALAADLESVEDRERRQLARDLHDDLGQTLAAARIRLAVLCNHRQADVRVSAAAIDELIDLAAGAIRSLAAQLTPEVLHEIGLSAALDWLVGEIERVFGLEVRLLDDGLPKPLPQDTRSILYRATRELLINVAKHAGTKTALLEADCEDAHVVIRISDGGVGYDVGASPSELRVGQGLAIVRERLASIGGTFEIRSRLGSGTVAILSVPLMVAPEQRGRGA